MSNRLKRAHRRGLVMATRLPRPDILISEPSENDETDHLIEEWIGEAMGSQED
jgi:hypothetical protein